MLNISLLPNVSECVSCMSCMPTSFCHFSAAHIFLSDVFTNPVNQVSLLSDGLQGQPQWLQLQRDVEVETVTQQPKTKKGANHCPPSQEQVDFQTVKDNLALS